MDGMQKMAAVLPSWNESERPAGSWNDGLGECPRCHADLEPDYRGEAIQHACCYCLDARRIRTTETLTDQRFGKTSECPYCTGNSTTPAFDATRSRIPLVLGAATLETWIPASGSRGPRAAAEQFAATWPPERFIMLISGPPGRGKSHLAVGIQRRVYELHGKASRFWVVPELLDRIKATFNEETRRETIENVHDEMTRIPLLVLDDLGTEKSTEWAEEELFKLIDRRYREMLPLVVTTNLETFNIGARLNSRLGDARYSTTVWIDPNRYPDRRQKAVNA